MMCPTLFLRPLKEAARLEEDRVLIGLRQLSRKPEEPLALPISMPEQQAQELTVDEAGGARYGRHEGDTMVVRIGRLLLERFLPGGLPRECVRGIRHGAR